MADIGKRFIKRPFQQVGGTLLSGIALIVIPFLPRRLIVRLARQLGTWGLILARRENAIAQANLDLVYGSRLTSLRKRAIIRRSFQTFMLMVLDLFWFTFRSRSRFARYTRIEPSMLQFLKPGGRIFVTAHYGNWEILGQATAATGYQLVSVAKPIDNFLLDWLLIRFREKNGQIILPQTGALRRMMGLLRDGMGVALLLDQDTSPRKGGLVVDFFGKPVTVSTAAASFSRKFKVPVIITFARATGGIYRFYALDEAFNIREDETEIAFTQRLVSAIEAEIRRHPGQWLWMYKRWKRYFPGQTPTRYHFYATR
jgi:KDO2-lipid IV(A) lauroyltransferase